MNNVIYEEIKVPEGKSPIWFCDVDYQITVKRKPFQFTVEKIVAKGTYDEMLKSKRVKISVLKEHFKGLSGVQKKIANFDFSRLTIKKIHIRHSMGFGIKE